MVAPAIEAGIDKHWAYAELMNSLEMGSATYLEKLETDTTKCGFGPNEEGTGCIKRALDSNPDCQEELVLALKQGCAMEGSNKCISPPQASNSNILYSGPRIILAFGDDVDSVSVSSIACSGD